MKKTMFISIFLASFFITNAKTSDEIQLDSLKESHQFVFIGDGDNPHKDSIRAMVDMFYMDQFRHFQDPRAPYFLFMSKDSQLAMGIGGVVRMRGWVDWGGVIPYNGFIPYAISVPRDKVNRK
jgi:hypothetical protein